MESHGEKQRYERMRETEETTAPDPEKRNDYLCPLSAKRSISFPYFMS